ncbi:hypothetical protein BVC80_1543g7 [Macleaya cordata]|uniref:Uncharacterized protein n=1 Tax=Macleaya cordata TaxID=56857 RepID=A0A200R1I7_MACCD|nr:hypothetical protein BVC80_1543g7 [Macleaya cordata]
MMMKQRKAAAGSSSSSSSNKLYNWAVIPCAGKSSLRTESRKDIQDILKTKLATIHEESEIIMCLDDGDDLNQLKDHHHHHPKRRPFRITDVYVHFVIRFASKARL